MCIIYLFINLYIFIYVHITLDNILHPSVELPIYKNDDVFLGI